MKKKFITSLQIFLIIFGLTIQEGSAQTSLNIDSCYAMAKRNYPLIKQFELILKSKEFTIDNVNKGNQPQFNVAGFSTYQSEVTSVPIAMLGSAIPELSKFQYKLYGEVNQSLTNLYTTKNQKELIEANGKIDEQKIEVQLYELKNRINQIYFGILLIDAQIQQTDYLKKDILLGIEKTQAAIANGVALKSNEDVLKAELLSLHQQNIQLKANRKGFTEMLSLLINKPIYETTSFQKPLSEKISLNINRPEIQLFNIQKKSIDLQSKIIDNKTLPNFSVFLQGGLGRPALNMLSNDLRGYYIGGLRVNWNLSSFYTRKNDKQILKLNQQSLDNQKETFIFNTTLNMKQQNAEINKLKELIQTDNEIIILRSSIKNTSKTQLEFGTATANDYLNYVNAEDKAKQNQILHQIQLLMAQYNYQNIIGN